jgi:hypothetical protein
MNDDKNKEDLKIFKEGQVGPLKIARPEEWPDSPEKHSDESKKGSD